MNTDPHATATDPPVPRRSWVTPRGALAVAIAVFVVVTFALSWLRAVELQTTTWDEGIYQQALWTTAHGRTFYETADLETGGFHSLLQVHTVLLFYLLAPVYGALPYQATLFAVQSLVVGLAAVPLYLLARRVAGSGWLGWATALVYLFGVAALGSTLYDFHAEALLPLEVFSVLLLWEQGRYRLGAVVVGLSFLTIELAPVLLFFVGVYYVLPPRSTWDRWLGLARRDRARGIVSDAVGWLRTSRGRATLGLLLASPVAYLALLLFRVDYLAGAVGTTALPIPAVGYVIGGTPASLGLSLGNLGSGFVAKLSYWALALALLGFVPLLAPRALVLAAPWFAFTLLSANLNYVELGFQYGFLVAAGLMPAFAFGLPRAVAVLRRWFDRGPAPTHEAGPARRSLRSSAPRPWVLVGAAALVVLLALNVAVSPLDPVMQNQGLGSAYRLSYTVPNGSTDVPSLAALIPSGATVVASDDLFPLVANDPNAYSFSWIQDNALYLPFNATHPPAYVFLAEDRIGAVPSWIASEVYNSSEFGVAGVVWNSVAGTVLLFEQGYTGPMAAWGPTPPTSLLATGASLLNTQAGYAPSGLAGAGAASAGNVPGVTGTFLWGPYVTLPAGTYTVRMTVDLTPGPGAPADWADTAALWIGAGAFAQPEYVSLYESANGLGLVSGGSFATVTFAFTTADPVLQFAVQAVALSPNVQDYVDAVQLVGGDAAPPA